MGVHGLWKLLEPSGTMVPLETLAGKVLAVDVSIWLHQAIKGVHDTHGAPVTAAHLLILFHRICKLLFYKIKPIFVFDGGVPALKQATMAARRRQSNSVKAEAVKIREKLIKNLLKHEAVRQVLANETASAALGLNSFTLPGPSVEEDLYKLPPIAVDYEKSSDEQESDAEQESVKFVEDIHSIDVTSKEFLNLPPEVRHDILTELMETRKQNSWKYLSSMPKESDNFSDFQMNRLLKRHAVKVSLEKAGKEMGGKTLSLKELESMLGNEGVLDDKTMLSGKRIAQDSITKYMLIQNNSNNKKNVQEKKQETTQKFDIMSRLEDVEWSSDSDTGKNVENCERKQTELEIQQEIFTKAIPSKLTLTGSCQDLKLPKVQFPEEIANILGVLEDDDLENVDKLKLDVSFDKKKQVEKNFQFSNSEENDIYKKFLGDINVNENKEKNETKINDIKIKKNTQCNDNVVKLEVNSSEKELINTEENLLVKDSNNLCSNNFESIFVAPASTETDVIQNDYEEVHNTMSSKTISKEYNKNDVESDIVVHNSPAKEDDIFADVFENNVEVSKENEEKWEHKNSFTELKKITNKHKTEFEDQLSKIDLVEWKKSLDENQKELVKEHGKKERHALNLTDQMYLDAQDLLKLFGVPFVIAPMEAEAQCAVLNTLGLTEGTITDDSDIWLFGGGVVYKNFFNQNKYVLEYKSDSIKKCFRLGREDLIKMAYLVGSDYTLGLNGIGPVTALEILAAFPGTGENLLESLEKFRDWFTGKSKNSAPKTKLRNKIKNTVILQGFPNKAVAEAYLRPHVDNSTESFSWAKPNLDLIREFTKSKMGWSFDKAQELLLPVLKKLEENKNQYTLEKFFKKIQDTPLTSGMMSKRVENAVKQLGGEEIEDPNPKFARKGKPRKKNAVKSSSTNDNGNFEKQKSDIKPKRKRKSIKSDSSEYFSEIPVKIEKKENLNKSDSEKESKIKIINEKLHRVEKIPQKERAQTLLEERKKEAVKIFKTYKGKRKKKIVIYSKKSVNLSESSSEND